MSGALGRLRAQRWSSRRRLSVQIGVALVALWAFVGWVSVTAVRDAVYEDIDEELTAAAHETASALEVVTAEELEAIRTHTPGSRETSLLILGERGTELFVASGSRSAPDPPPAVATMGLGPLRARAGVPFTVDPADGEERLRVVTMPLDDGRVLVLARPLDDAAGMVRSVARVMTIGFLVTVVGVTLLVWFITRQALKPLEDVIATADEIGAGTLGTRVEVTSTAPDVVRLADALNVMLERLEGAFGQRDRTERRLRQFVADASHELRTPLAGILGYAELYQQLPDDPARDRAVERIAIEAERMRALVDGLLTLARLDEGRSLSVVPVAVGEVLEDAVAVARTIDSGHRFTLVAAEPVTVGGDRQALRQVVDNLLANVIAHTPAGTAAQVRLRREGEEAVVEVHDDGPGLDGDDAAHAFDRFWRAAPDRGRPGGSGLGLAIVQELVGAHGGTTSLTSAPGEGTCVEVRLPIDR